MNYAASLLYLSGLARFGIRPGTERLAAVLARLGDPQDRVPALHIAGTNGKGSTAAFAAHLLLAAAQPQRGASATEQPRVGLYTSPHLCRLRERIRISPAQPQPTDEDLSLPECSEEDLAAALSAVRAAAEAAPAVDLTFFEVLTAAAFLLFAAAGVEVAVFETGLGGRLDATRLCAARVTVITGIALDHTEILGDTLTAIAYEKAGIFRPGVPALCACDDAAARAVLIAEAGRVGAPLSLLASPDDPAGLPSIPRIPPLPAELAATLPLPGAHQYANAAMALAAVRTFPGSLGAATTDPDVQRRGLTQTRWPGRLERLWPDRTLAAADLRQRLDLPPDAPLPEVWIDGAHNAQGAEALARFMAALPAGRPLSVLFGVVRDKSVDQMLAPLRLAERLILTTPPSPRARPADELAACIAAAEPGLPGLPDAHIEPDPLAALRFALRTTPEDGRLLIYGSLFLLGALRARWHNEIRDPVALSDPGPGSAPKTSTDPTSKGA
jgi:dihydrofolate synthase/folylpolyglutamate synthase